MSGSLFPEYVGYSLYTESESHCGVVGLILSTTAPSSDEFINTRWESPLLQQPRFFLFLLLDHCGGGHFVPFLKVQQADALG